MISLAGLLVCGLCFVLWLALSFGKFQPHRVNAKVSDPSVHHQDVVESTGLCVYLLPYSYNDTYLFIQSWSDTVILSIKLIVELVIQQI